jgi:hypothetical protein
MRGVACALFDFKRQRLGDAQVELEPPRTLDRPSRHRARSAATWPRRVGRAKRGVLIGTTGVATNEMLNGEVNRLDGAIRLAPK